MQKKRKYGLLEKDIESITSILKSNSKIDSIILFGSRAKGNYLDGSDIDIAIKGKGLNLDDILNAKVSLEDLSLPYKIDVIIYERIKESELLSHIDRIGITLFKK